MIQSSQKTHKKMNKQKVSTATEHIAIISLRYIQWSCRLVKETQHIKPNILIFVLTGARETDSSKKVNHGRVNWNLCLSNILFI